MNLKYVKKINKIRFLVNGEDWFTGSDKDIIPYYSPEADEMYIELVEDPQFSSIECAEAIALFDYYWVTGCSEPFPVIYERFKEFANTKRYVEILKNDISGVDKKEQATQIFKAVRTIPNALYGPAKNGNKKLLPECWVLVVQMLYDFGDSLMEYFSEDSIMMNIVIKAWKEGIRRQTQWKHWKVSKKNFDIDKMQEYAKKIRRIDAAYSIPKAQSAFSVWWKGLEE